ncbi:hypothetical protein OG535_29770 [Kitasatospora sp. NBC_00085]|uniref:hypothetical protein n=1 Tax=unclassified Kitasatospora TaxID=2633591 RepID=UPI0032472176
MDDIPQGGAGGVPGHHDDTGDRGSPDQQDRRDRQVKTVRAGEPVAEQQSDRQEPGREQAAGDRVEDSGSGE